MGPESSFLFSPSPSFCICTSLRSPTLGSRLSGQLVVSRPRRACADLSALRLPAHPLLGAGLAQPQLQAGDHLGENGHKLDPPIVGDDGGPSSPGLPRKAEGPLLCLCSGSLGSESIGWSRGRLPSPREQSAGNRDKGLIPPPTHPPTRQRGAARCPGALGLCPCFVFHLHPSPFSRSS